MADVEFIRVSKTYDKAVKAVNDVSIKIPDGEFAVLVGPSGCGKSTMLRMVAGLESITDGVLNIGGKKMNNVHPRDRDIAMVFQNYALYPHKTVYDNIGFCLKLRDETAMKIEERVLEAGQMLGLNELMERYPKTLSGGQRQRVALGRAIVRQAKVFLFDEPLSNLDAKFRNQMRSEITNLHNRLKTTFIYVTHDQLEAMTMGTLIIVLKDGIVQQADAPQTIYDSPENVFVATFIGLPPMNLINSKLVQNDGLWRADMFNTGITVPQEVARRFKKDVKANTEIIAGFRPEDVIVTDPGGGIIQAEVNLVEFLGNESLIYLKTEGQDGDIVSRQKGGTTIKTGQPVGLRFNTDKIHLFSGATQQTLLMRKGGKK